MVASALQSPDFFCSHWYGTIGYRCITTLFGRWGESISKFVLCVARHCIDRAFMSEKGMVNGKCVSPHPGYLGGRSPNYWCAIDHSCHCCSPHRVCTRRICAYANRQFDLASEISGDSLEDTSFFRAMRIARGTISIIDEEGKVFTRIWVCQLHGLVAS